MIKIRVTAVIVVFFSMVALTVITPYPASATTTVDLDAVINDASTPVIALLETGFTYTATAVPTPASIGEDSWNAWTAGGAAAVNIIGSVDYAPGLRGWLNRYEIIVDGAPSVVVWDGKLHQTPELAFLNTPVYTFDVVSDSMVRFFIGDSESKDNWGGMSLEVSQVPIPGALWLFGSGLIGLVGIRKRLKS